MKVLSMNLNTYQEDQQFEKFMRIAKKIVDEDVDVVLFCEAGQSLMSPYIEGDIRKDNAIKIICDKVNELLGTQIYRFKWDMVHFGFKIYEEGLAIMSKHSLENIQSCYITKTSDHFTFKSRKVLKATIKNIDFYSCHMGWEDDENEPFSYQLHQLDQYVKDVSMNRLAIIGGTFNNDVKTKSYQDIINLGYIDLYRKANPEGMYEDTLILPEGYQKEDSYRLDYIFSNKNQITIKNVKYLFEKTDRVSDHVAILIEFEAA